MLKGLSGLLAVVLVTTTGISHVFCDVCLSTTGLWGDDDPHYFYYCDTTVNEAMMLPCPTGKGYIGNDETQGCVDWTEWSSNCISQAAISAATCVGAAAKQPQASGDPSYFYLCLEESFAPVKIACKPGYGFYSGNKYLGCFPWSQWRTITGCVNTDLE